MLEPTVICCSTQRRYTRFAFSLLCIFRKKLSASISLSKLFKTLSESFSSMVLDRVKGQVSNKILAKDDLLDL